MSPSAPISTSARSWRDIPQSIAPRAMSSTGRQRMIFANTKSIAILALACLCCCGGYEVYRTWEDNPSKLKAPVRSSPVKNISLRGQNLVLDQPWAVHTLALPKNADLMELDLYALREKLLESGQVSTAVVTRKFPDTLLVSIDERSPVARINARFGSGEPETFLVARDGVVYQGACYKPETIQSLPYLAGVLLRRHNGKFQPIAGMAIVADLLSTARVNAPNLYHGWSVVSLDKFGSDGEIVVQSTEGGRITFGTRDDFFKQVARLDYIIDQSHLHPTPTPLQSINLAVGEQVPVSFQRPANNGESLTAPPATRTSSGNNSRSLTPSAAHPRTYAAPTRPLQAQSISIHRSTRRDL